MEWTSVKKGWVYQRKKHLLLPTSWTPKYLVLYSAPIPALAVYEQRSDAMPPYAPQLHLELTGGKVNVDTAHGSSRSGGWFSSVAEGISSSVASRRASIVSGISRKSSFRDLKQAGQEAKAKSYKDRVLDEQGFMVSREAGDGQPALRLCFAVESKEERDYWMAEISRVIDFACRKGVMVAENELSRQAEDCFIQREINLGERSESADLSIVCCGMMVLDDKTVKRILQKDQHRDSFDGSSEDDEIQTSQILTNSSPALTSNLITEDLNLKFQLAVAERRSGRNAEEKRRAELKMLSLIGSFQRSIQSLVKKTIDGLHRTRSPLPQGILHEDGLCRIQFVADYQASQGAESDEAGCSWVHQEMMGSKWIMSQDAVAVHGMLMASVEYKGFRAVGLLKLPLSPQSTLTVDAETCLIGEEGIQLLRELAKELGLMASYPWRLQDGRTIQMALHPSVQLHHVHAHTMAPTGGPMVVGKQAGRIQGGTPACALTPTGNYLVQLSELVPQWSGEEAMRLVRPEMIKKAVGPVGAGSLHSDSTLQSLSGPLNETIKRLISDLENLRILPIDSIDWINCLHARGLSCSLLGELASRTRLPHVKESLAIEMIGRTLKKAVRSQLRQTILHFRQVQALLVDEELAGIAVGTVNALLSVDGNNREWQKQFLSAVEANYGYKIEVEDLRGLSRQALLSAVQHHCGFQFRFDALQSIREGSPIEPGHFVRFLSKSSASYEPFQILNGEDEEEAVKVRIAAKTMVPKVSGEAASASLAADFEHLAQATRDQTALKLSKNTCPSHHARMASILMTDLEINSNWDLSTSINAYERASAIVKNHLGEHHPLHLLLADRFISILRLHQSDSTESTWECLKLRQTILQTSSKVLGKAHSLTKAQHKFIGDLQLELGEWDMAIDSYSEAAKQQAGSDAEALVEIRMKLAECYQEKEDLEIALSEMQSCRGILEKELPKKAGEDRQRLIKLHESVLMSLGKLAQSFDENSSYNGMISANVEERLELAIECYESLFEAQRARAESSSEGEHLVNLLQKILSLKLRLAPAAARAVISLTAKQQKSSQVDDKSVHDFVVKLLSGAHTPSSFMDKLLEKSVSPQTMKEAEFDLRTIIQFTSTTA